MAVAWDRVGPMGAMMTEGLWLAIGCEAGVATHVAVFQVACAATVLVKSQLHWGQQIVIGLGCARRPKLHFWIERVSWIMVQDGSWTVCGCKAT